MPVLMMTRSSGGAASIQRSPSTLTWRPRAVARGRAVIRLMSPCSAAQTCSAPGEIHGRVVDGPGQGGAAVGHGVEERLVTADADGDDPQEAALEVEEAVVELDQHLGDPGHLGLGQHGPEVPVGEVGPQGMPVGEGGAPVEHLLPVRGVADGGRLDQEAGVADLPVGAGHDRRLLLLGREAEELLQQGVGRVEEVVAEVVAGVDEAGGEAAPHPVDHGPPLGLRSILEGQQINIENLAHGITLTRSIVGGAPAPSQVGAGS